MAYFDELRPAGFRNVPFEAFAVTDGGGRRGTVNQFPKTNAAQFNDRGGKTKPVTLNAAVFGEDAFAQADKLEEALNKEGSGRLVHPTKGAMQATCTDYTRKTTSNSGLRVNFALEFFIHPEVKSGVKVTQNPTKLAETQELAMNDSSATAFADKFETQGQPGFILDEAKKDLGKMVAEISAFLGDTSAATAAFVNDLNALINEPFKLAQNMQDLIAATVRAASFSNISIRQRTRTPSTDNTDSTEISKRTSGASNAFGNTKVLQNFKTNYQSIPITTSTRQVQQQNSKAIELVVRESATVVEAQLHRGDEGATLFKTQSEAQQNLKSILKQLQIRKNEAPVVAANISQLMAATATVSSSKYGVLAELKMLTIAIDTNTLILAYELYDDIKREFEIRRTNNLTDTFIKKGTVLQVFAQ